MERKLISQGGQALTVSLPIGWIRKHGLFAKDVVQIEEKDHVLEISTEKKAPVTEVTIDVRSFDYLPLLVKVVTKYIQGYDTIKILHGDLGHVQKSATWLMGMFIESYEEGFCVLKSIVSVPETDPKKLIIKATHILKTQAKSLITVARDKSKLEKLLSEEHLLDVNLLYCMRYLNKYSDRKYGHFLICAQFDMISDLMGEIAKLIGDDVIRAKKIAKVVCLYVDLLLKGDLVELDRIVWEFSESLDQETFMDGLMYSLAEIMYNYVGLMMDEIR